MPNIEAKIQFQRATLGFGFLPRMLIENFLYDKSLIQQVVEEPRPPEPVLLALRAGDKREAVCWW